MAIATCVAFAKDKVAFITGGASGIGAATVRKFAANQIKVCFLDIDVKKGNALAKEFSSKEVIFVPGNVKNPEEIKKGIEQTVATFGSLDIVFANAGIAPSISMENATIDEWDNVMNVNFRGVYFTVKESLPELRKNGGGSIIITSCSHTQQANLYDLSKASLDSLAKRVAREYGSQNIRVNAVAPGSVKTPLAEEYLSQQFGESKAKSWDLAATANPLKRTGSPEEVAGLVYYLTTDSASYITGGVIPVDGGKSIK